MQTTFHNPEPLPLIHTRRYPTYQLYAVAGNGKLSPEQTMVICILETFKWLRERFKEIGISRELEWPEPTAFKDVSLSDFSSFAIDPGYKLEVIVLHEEKAWSLQLIESDSGSRPGDPDQDRPPVPGRMFETNIGYRITDKGMECGFCTMVIEPSKTEEPCEVYRLAFIKKLARNPDIGLFHGYQLKDTPYQVNTKNEVKKLRNWLRSQDRTMAAVILTQCIVQEELSSRPSNILSIEKPFLPTIAELINTSPFNANPLKLDLNPEVSLIHCLLDEKSVARYKLGYVQVFAVDYAMLDIFRSEIKKNANPGDILLWEPEAFGGLVVRIKAKDITNETVAMIEEFGQNYPKDKPMTFGDVFFIPKAKEIESEKIIQLTQSREELLQAAARKEEGIIAHHNDELLLLEQKLEIANKKIRKLEENRKEMDQWKASLQVELIEIKDNHKRELAVKEAEMRRLKGLLDRPKTLKEVCSWVKCNYDGRMIFHARAVNLMDSIGPGEVDLPILCDALEFLATDYRDELRGLIDEVELKRRCSQKYNRPFTVTPLTVAAIEAYPADYKIKYYIGFTGKPVESPLDLHLFIGNKADNLLRIYFLYDKEKQLIVVGSLPKHLPTVGYK